MRYIKTVVSATQVKSTEYQLKAARKYQSSFNSLYTISGEGTNPVMIEMFNHDSSLIWALANIVISATSAGYKVVEHANKKNQLVRLTIRPYTSEEPEDEFHVFQKVNTPQMMLIMLEIARIIRMGVRIPDGAELPNIKYFHDDGTVINATVNSIETVVTQVSSNELLKELLLQVDTSELLRTVQGVETEVETPSTPEVVIVQSPIRVDEYAQGQEVGLPHIGRLENVKYAPPMKPKSRKERRREEREEKRKLKKLNRAQSHDTVTSFSPETKPNSSGESKVGGFMHGLSDEDINAIDADLQECGYNFFAKNYTTVETLYGVCFYPLHFKFDSDIFGKVNLKNYQSNIGVFSAKVLDALITKADCSKLISDGGYDSTELNSVIEYMQERSNLNDDAKIDSMYHMLSNCVVKDAVTGRMGIVLGGKSSVEGGAYFLVIQFVFNEKYKTVTFDAATTYWRADSIEVI